MTGPRAITFSFYSGAVIFALPVELVFFSFLAMKCDFFSALLFLTTFRLWPSILLVVLAKDSLAASY